MLTKVMTDRNILTLSHVLLFQFFVYELSIQIGGRLYSKQECAYVCLKQNQESLVKSQTELGTQFITNQHYKKDWSDRFKNVQNITGTDFLKRYSITNLFVLHIILQSSLHWPTYIFFSSVLEAFVFFFNLFLSLLIWCIYIQEYVCTVFITFQF